MKNNIFYILYLMIILIGFQSCDDDEDQSQFFNPPEVFNIDASSYDNWVYFSFESGIVIDVFEPDNSMDWDIAFKRNHIKTNGGLSGVGDGCGIVDSTQIWTNESFELTVDIPDNTSNFISFFDLVEAVYPNESAHKPGVKYNPDRDEYLKIVQTPIMNSFIGSVDSIKLSIYD